MFYPLIRQALFRLPAEQAHHLTLETLRTTYRSGFARLLAGRVPSMPCEVMGLKFRNPVGLAAGLDKNGEYIRPLAALGFGFIEIGTVTPRPQAGNPKPRLFRLSQAQALINRMGFNNKGVDYLVAQVRRAGYAGVLGINIGKNFDTPLEKATEDYVHCLNKVYPHAGYVVVNVSSPNTPGLRDLQHGDLLDDLLRTLKAEQMRLSVQYHRYVPLVVKLAPDMDAEAVRAMAEILLSHEVDGVAATNTTVDRESVQGLRHGDEAGGLSGKPLLARSTEILRELNTHLEGHIPLIGVGGITNGAGAVLKAKAGASLVQLYTGLIYRGPRLIGETVRALRAEQANAPVVAGRY